MISRHPDDRTITMSGKYNEKYVEEYNAAIAAYNRGDYEKAAEFMPKAAKEGDEYAQMVLGKMYYLGKGVERSAKKAVKWWRKAADAGNESAADLLKWAERYGCPKNVEFLLTDCFVSGDFEYVVTGMDRRVAVSEYKGVSVKPVLKYKVEYGGETYYLTGIGGYAFDGSQIESITIPEGVTTLGEACFEDQRELTKVVLPSSVTEIGTAAFEGCESLSKIDLGGTETIGDYAFEGCMCLKELILPESVRSIGKGAFQNCSSLKKVTIPCGVERLSKDVFRDCHSLKTVNVPDSLRHICFGAFENCAITTMELPAGVEKFTGGSFLGCVSLKTLTVAEGNIRYRSEKGMVYDDIDRKLVLCPAGKGANRVEVAPGTVSIGKCAFTKCTGLKEVVLPESLKKIGASAFVYCEDLENITFSEGLEEICYGAFAYCGSLRKIDVPDSLRKMGDYSLYETSVTDIRLPKGTDRSLVFGVDEDQR